MASAAAFAVVAVIGAPSSAYAKNGAGDVFSSQFLNIYCQRSQKIIAETDLKSDNIVYSDLGPFVGSDASPYGDQTPPVLPFETTQYVTYGVEPGGSSYTQTVWCKMKSYDALAYYYEDSVNLDPLPQPPFFAGKPTCSDVNRQMVKKVVKALGKDVVVPEIVYEDFPTFSGLQWTSNTSIPVPSTSPSAYFNNGVLHIVGKELFVTRVLPPFIQIPESKKGVDYCQAIAPDYVREILTGNVTPPDCQAPPTYAPPGPGSSPFPQLWETYPGSGEECKNP